MNNPTYTNKIRLENLIKSNQSVHTVCIGDYSLNRVCNFGISYINFKCKYKVDSNCTYQNKGVSLR